MNRRVLLAAASLCVSCIGPTKRFDGAATLTAAQGGVQAGRIAVRPNEMTWELGEPVQFQRRVNASEMGDFVSTAPVVSQAGVALPPEVNFAAALSLMESQGDGLLVTNHLTTTETSGLEITYDIKVWGRLLVLKDLGPMSKDRADLRGRVRSLEAVRRQGEESTAPPPDAQQSQPQR